MFLRGESGGADDLFSVGVGGVTVVKGVVRVVPGGVWGRFLVSRLAGLPLETLKLLPLDVLMSLVVGAGLSIVLAGLRSLMLPG